MRLHHYDNINVFVLVRLCSSSWEGSPLGRTWQRLLTWQVLRQLMWGENSLETSPSHDWQLRNNQGKKTQTLGRHVCLCKQTHVKDLSVRGCFLLFYFIRLFNSVGTSSWFWVLLNVLQCTELSFLIFSFWSKRKLRLLFNFILDFNQHNWTTTLGQAPWRGLMEGYATL